jgi:hypothetical protein
MRKITEKPERLAQTPSGSSLLMDFDSNGAVF